MQQGGRPTPNVVPTPAPREQAPVSMPRTVEAPAPSKDKKRLLPWFMSDNDNLDE